MKINKFFLALTMGIAVVACQPKAEQAAEGETDAAATEAAAEVAPKEKTAKDFLPSRSELNDVSYLVGINFGSFIKNYNFGDLNYAQIRKGMEDFLNAKGNPGQPGFEEQFRVDPNRMNELFNGFLENRRNYTLYTNRDKEEKFLGTKASSSTEQCLTRLLRKESPQDSISIALCAVGPKVFSLSEKVERLSSTSLQNSVTETTVPAASSLVRPLSSMSASRR